MFLFLNKQFIVIFDNFEIVIYFSSIDASDPIDRKYILDFNGEDDAACNWLTGSGGKPHRSIS
jgi:hypothetical protein